MENETILIDGMFFKKPREGAPDFVKGAISIKMSEFIPFIKKYKDEEWLNIDLLKSKKGNLYLKLNTYKPSKEQIDEVKKELNSEDMSQDVDW